MISPGSLDQQAPTARSAAPAVHRAEAPRRQPAPEEVALDAVPFGALLNAFTNPANANQARGGAASSFGVFQSGNASGHEQKQAALREGQASRRADARARYNVDRTGVDARRFNQAESRGADSSKPPQATLMDQDRSEGLIRGAGAQGSAGSTGGSSESELMLDRLGDRSRQGEPTGTPTARADAAGRGAAQGPRGSAASPQIAQVSAAAATPPSAPSPSTDVAQEMGRTLGASRVGEVESARAPTAPSQAGLGRTGRQASGRNEPPPAGSRPDKTGSSPDARPTKDIEPTPFDRLVRSIRMQAGEHRSTARMMLDPPELGRVLVDVAMVGDTVAVSVRAETLEARELLRDRVAQLRRALLKQGIEIERFTVVGDWPGEAAATDSDSSGRDEVPAPAPRLRRSQLPREVDPKAASPAGPKNEEPSDNVRNTVAQRRIDVRI